MTPAVDCAHFPAVYRRHLGDGQETWGKVRGGRGAVGGRNTVGGDDAEGTQADAGRMVGGAENPRART